MPFKSLQPDITLPRDLTIYQWLFTSPAYSPLHNHPKDQQAGYQNALTKERLSWPQVHQASTHLSTALASIHGLKPGQTVALFSQNTIWYPVAMLAALRLGAVVSGASPAYSVDEMSYALRTAGAAFLMTHPGSVEVAVRAAANAGIPRERVFLLEGEVEGFVGVKGLIEQGRELVAAGQEVPVWEMPEGKKNGDVCAFLSFSSGTTGLPKAVSFSFSFLFQLQVFV